MLIFHLAISNNNISAGRVYTSAIVISARRDGDTVISRVEGFGGHAQEFTWDGELVWDYAYSRKD
jgi:hypothetical protein